MFPCSIQEISRETWDHWILPTEKNWRKRHFDVCLLFPVSVGAFPTVTHVSWNFYLKMTSRQGFPLSGLLSANRMLGHLCSLVEWAAMNRVLFRHLSFHDCCLDSKMWEDHASTDALNSRDTASKFPWTFHGSWAQYSILLGLLMRKESEGVCLTQLSAILFLSSLIGIPIEMILPQGVACCLLASKIPGFWPKLLLSLVGKDQLYWLSRSC